MRERLVAMGALVGESDHGVSKSLYGHDPDGIEFEVLWTVPSDAWGDLEHEAIVQRLDPFLVGGAQERARRAGIEDVPAWVGFGAACAAIDVTREGVAQRALISTASRVIDTVPGVTRFGATGPDDALPNVLCLGVDGVEAEPILLALDQHGVAVHSGSSGSSETLEP